jgi:hypothetical protein
MHGEGDGGWLLKRSVTAASSSHAQKPSNARPTQLNANIEQTTATTDAKVAIVFAERMTGPFVGNDQTLSNNLCSMMARIRHDE